MGRLGRISSIRAERWGGMANNKFDERYPAMFQPGGEDLAADSAWLTPKELPPTMTAGARAGKATTWRSPKKAPEPVLFVVPPLQIPARAPALSNAPSPTTAEVENDGLKPVSTAGGHGARPENEGPETEGPDGAAPSPDIVGDGTVQKSARLPWRVATIVGVVLLAAGAMAPGVPQWIANNSTDHTVIQMAPMWIYTASQVAAPMLGLGLGVLALLLLLAIRMHPTRRTVLRSLFALATLAVLAFGLFAQFSAHIFPPVQHEAVDSVNGANTYYFSQPDFVISLGLLAFGPLLIGILMVAALVVSRNFSFLRSYVMGLLLLGAAVFAQCAPYLFPNVRPTTQMFDGGNQSIPGWPFWLPELTPALVAAGALVIATAAAWPSLRAVCLAVVPKTGTATPSSEDLPTDAADQEEVAEHVHAAL